MQKLFTLLGQMTLEQTESVQDRMRMELCVQLEDAYNSHKIGDFIRCINNVIRLHVVLGCISEVLQTSNIDEQLFRRFYS